MGQLLTIDTRQKAGKHDHVDRWLAAHGVGFEYRKLDFGDYMAEGSNVSVDTKQDLQEVAGNLGKDHRRFSDECERARANGCRLVVLVEERPEFNDRARIASWVPVPCRRCPHRRLQDCRKSGVPCKKYRRKPMQGARVMSTMAGMERDRGVRFEFCRKADTARRICELLGVRFNE